MVNSINLTPNAVKQPLGIITCHTRNILYAQRKNFCDTFSCLHDVCTLISFASVWDWRKIRSIGLKHNTFNPDFGQHFVKPGILERDYSVDSEVEVPYLSDGIYILNRAAKTMENGLWF